MTLKKQTMEKKHKNNNKNNNKISKKKIPPTPAQPGAQVVLEIRNGSYVVLFTRGLGLISKAT